jgi:hypothetical protein
VGFSWHPETPISGRIVKGKTLLSPGNVVTGEKASRIGLANKAVPKDVLLKKAVTGFTGNPREGT